MKKHYKVLAVFLTVVLVVCCCFSVSAATINAGTGNQVYVGDDSNAGPVLSGNANADGSYWINYYGGRTGNCLGIMYPVNLLVNRGDIVKWGAFYTSFYFSISSTTTYSVTLCLMDEYYGFTPLETEMFSTAKKGGFGEQFEGGEKQFDFDFDVRYICIMLDGVYGQSSAGTFAWHPYTFKVSSMDENSIMLEGMISEQEKTNELLGDITADKYTPPSGGEEIGNLNQTEEELLGSSAEGMNDTKLLFSNFNILQFSNSMLGVISIVNTFVDGMPWLSEIIIISLTIGIFGFLFGLASIVVGRLSASKRYEQRHNNKKGGG